MLMNMRRQSIKVKRYLACFMAFTMILGCYSEIAAFAAEVILPPPQNNKMTDIGYVQNAFRKEWYAELAWDPVVFPADATEKIVTVGFNEAAWGTGGFISDAIQIPLPGGATTQSINEYTPETIKHGCIYETYVKAAYKYNTTEGQYTVQSQKSNPVKFLTGLDVSLELVPGTNNIKIIWDDVWDSTGRISYRIMISDTQGFTQPPPVPDIVASEIGQPGSPVVVNASVRKLEFIYTHALPGREYAIKIVPLPNIDVACATSEEIPAITIKTDILLQASKVGFTNDGGVIWKLSWNPIVKGSTFARVDYELYRYTNSELTGQLYRLIPDRDSYQITIAGNDTNTYSFKIDAKAYAPGSDIPIEFRSNAKVALKEQVPEQPAAPELIDSFPSAAPHPLIYEDLLTSNTASTMWNVFYTGDGLVDNDITYDIYLVDDIRDVSQPSDDYKIASDVSMNEANQIKDINTGKVLGYKYDLVGLTSNSTYYFVIYAKKNYLVRNPVDGVMISMPFISKQAVKVIITRPDTGTDRPVAPSSPPFGVKPDPGSINYTGATLQMDKKWHVLYDTAHKKWEYVTEIVYNQNEALLDTNLLKRDAMIINYTPGWKIVPHVVSFNDALNVIRLRNNGRVGDYIAYSDLSQSDLLAFQIEQSEVNVPVIADDQDQTFEFDIDGLTHNTTYIVWLTVKNQNGSSSDPSDPIIITTLPEIPVIPVTPTVPNDLKGIASDDFIDLFWTFRSKMSYDIRCGTSDNIDDAGIQASVTYEELVQSTFYRLEGLIPDTLYYVWIKAISTASDGTILESEYSNPLTIKTEAYKPPAPPSGFGVKSGADGVTENSIIYVWETKADFKYYLEFADNINFDKSSMNEISGSTYTASALISNRRYYARLYAYDNKTMLRSLPTGTVMVVTNKSKSDYDSSYDLDDVPGGDALVISPSIVNGVWTAGSTGVNAHRMAEQIRDINGPIVQIDLSQPPSRVQSVRLDLGAVLIDTLSELKKELYIKLPSVDLIILPDSLQNDEYFKLKNTDQNFSLRLEAVSPATSYTAPADLKAVTPVTKLAIGAANSAGKSFSDLARPIRVDLPVTGLSGFKANEIKTYLFDEVKKTWSVLETSTDYTGGKVSGEMTKPGAVVAATKSVAQTGTVPVAVLSSLNSIQAVFNLNSLAGKPFNYAASVSQEDVVKLLLDAASASYNDEDYLTRAVRCGIVGSSSDINEGYARRDQTIDLLVNYYRFKTREPAMPVNPVAWASFKDMSKVRGIYLNSVKFAAENGIVQGNGENVLNPDKMATYGELVIMLEKVLKLCGEL